MTCAMKTGVSMINILTANKAHVDREMCVYRAHLVKEAFCNAGNHVLDHGLDSSQASDVLSSTVPNDKLDS